MSFDQRKRKQQNSHECFVSDRRIGQCWDVTLGRNHHRAESMPVLSWFFELGSPATSVTTGILLQKIQTDVERIDRWELGELHLGTVILSQTGSATYSTRFPSQRRFKQRMRTSLNLHLLLQKKLPC